MTHKIRTHYKKNLVYIILLAVSCLYPVGVQTQITQPAAFPAAEAPSSKTAGAYQPFTAPQQLGDGGGQVLLRGPGDDPIGGLPVSDSTYVFFFCVMGYAVYKMISQRVKRTKN